MPTALSSVCRGPSRHVTATAMPLPDPSRRAGLQEVLEKQGAAIDGAGGVVSAATPEQRIGNGKGKAAPAHKAPTADDDSD